MGRQTACGRFKKKEMLLSLQRALHRAARAPRFRAFSESSCLAWANDALLLHYSSDEVPTTFLPHVSGTSTATQNGAQHQFGPRGTLWGEVSALVTFGGSSCHRAAEIFDFSVAQCAQVPSAALLSALQPKFESAATAAQHTCVDPLRSIIIIIIFASGMLSLWI